MSGLSGRAGRAIARFAFSPARAEPLAVLRIGLAFLLLAQAAAVAPAYLDLFGRSGVIQGSLRDALARPGLPDVHWLHAHLGLAETPILVAAAALYLLALAALGAGLFTRAAAAVAWLVHTSLLTAGKGLDYGADQFGHMFLFYLLFVPSGGALSLDHRRRRAPAQPSWQARLGLRVVQLHLCMVYLFSGVQKAMGPDWWSGASIWRSLMLPEYRQLDFSWLAAHPIVPAALGWTVMLVELGYPVLVWPRRTRRLWVAATVAMHLGIAAFLGLHVFGVMMALLTLAAFGVEATPPPARTICRAAGRG